MKFVKNLLFSIFLLILFANLCHAFELDETVDDEIRKNYNDSKLIKDSGIGNSALDKNLKTKSNNSDEELPALPSITKQNASTKTPDVSGQVSSKTSSVPPKTVITQTNGNIRIHKGTTFLVSSSNAISDWQTRGTKVKFVTNKQIQTKKYTIPAWTSFNGEIVDSHQPQITCNGGLVSIKVYSMTLKGQTYPINAYVIRANDKKVFFNDIKGQRTYMKTVWKKGGWGRNIFNRMLTLTVKLGSDGSTLLLSPFPVAYGTICFGLNTLASPITAFFSKGGHVSIPSGSLFKIKLTEDAYID